MIETDLEERKEILRKAHYWRFRMSQSDATQAECAQFETWLASDPRHAELYDRAETFFQAMGTLEEDDLGKDVIRKTLLEDWLRFQHIFVKRLRAGLPKIAVTSIGLAGLAFIAVITVAVNRTPTPIDYAITTASFQTDIGEIKEFTLDDGTIITLGAASNVQTTYRNDVREAELISGAAMFNVSSDKERPFSVKAGNLTAKVLGTVFDVTQSGDVTRVSVAEGSVEVSHPFVIDKSLSTMSVRRELKAGEQIAARAQEGLGQIATLNIETIGGWRENTLYYQGSRLSELVADANRYSNDHVVIQSDADEISSLLVQGSFKADDIDGMLTILSEVYPVVIDRSKPGVVAIRPQDNTK